MANTLESLSGKSKIVVHNSAADLADKSPLQAYQGAELADVVNFEKVIDDLTAPTSTNSRGQALKFGESIFQVTGAGATHFVCTGEYGKTLIDGEDITGLASGTYVNGSGGDVTTNHTLTGGSVINDSDEVKVSVIIAADGSLTSVIVTRRGTNYKAGDILVIPGNTIGSGGATPANDLTIELDQAILNKAQIVSVGLTNI